MDKFPERLRHLRETKRPLRSQRVTSELCGLHPDAIRRYERGEVEPRLKELKAIAKYFGVTLDYLGGDDEESFESGQKGQRHDTAGHGRCARN